VAKSSSQNSKLVVPIFPIYQMPIVCD